MFRRAVADAQYARQRQLLKDRMAGAKDDAEAGRITETEANNRIARLKEDLARLRDERRVVV